MGKWSVPTVIKQLNTGKITLKFLSSTRDMLTQPGNNLADFIKLNGFDILTAIPESPENKGIILAIILLNVQSFSFKFIL